MAEVRQNRLYGDLAWTMPIITPPSEYVGESDLFAETIREHAETGVTTLLHLGCGAGHNDNTLKKHFRLTGVDLSETMLGLARRLNPEATYVQGDMRTVRLGKTFAAVIGLDSLGYMLTETDLKAAFTTAFVHLEPGGVFLTVQEYDPSRFQQNHTEARARAEGGVEITLVENKYDPDPDDTAFEATLIFLIRREGQLQVEADLHVCGLFGLDTWLRLLREVGFEVTQLEFCDPHQPAEPIPMLVCLKPREVACRRA